MFFSKFKLLGNNNIREIQFLRRQFFSNQVTTTTIIGKENEIKTKSISTTTEKVKGFVGKLKNPKKRAKSILNSVEASLISLEKANPKRIWPKFDVGDAIEVIHRESRSAPKSLTTAGIVTAIRKPNTYNANFELMAAIGENRVTYNFPFYAPMISEVRFLQKAHIHRGKKRVRRAKLYYLKDRPVSLLQVAASKQTIAEKARQVIMRQNKNKNEKKKAASGGKNKKASSTATASTTTNATPKKS